MAAKKYPTAALKAASNQPIDPGTGKPLAAGRQLPQLSAKLPFPGGTSPDSFKTRGIRGGPVKTVGPKAYAKAVGGAIKGKTPAKKPVKMPWER